MRGFLVSSYIFRRGGYRLCEICEIRQFDVKLSNLHEIGKYVKEIGGKSGVNREKSKLSYR